MVETKGISRFVLLDAPDVYVVAYQAVIEEIVPRGVHDPEQLERDRVHKTGRQNVQIRIRRFALQSRLGGRTLRLEYVAIQGVGDLRDVYGPELTVLKS